MVAVAEPQYRAFVLDRDDQIVERHEIQADTSEQAIEIARHYVDGHDVEVWLRTHIIARLKRSE